MDSTSSSTRRITLEGQISGTLVAPFVDSSAGIFLIAWQIRVFFGFKADLGSTKDFNDLSLRSLGRQISPEAYRKQIEDAYWAALRLQRRR